MGEAKRKEAELRAALAKELELWDKPGSDWEASMVAEIERLPVVEVHRESADRLAWARMKPRECHANCGWYVDNDPTGKNNHVVGWWRQGDTYVLHSVLEQDGHYVCITPQERDVPDQFAFIPDPAISWVPEGEYRRYMRGGQPIGPGLRADPEAHRASIKLMRERLSAGMKPRQVMALADQEAAERLGL